MDKNIEEKRKYFKDSMYLKYENQRNKDSFENNFKIEHSKKFNFVNVLQRVAVILIVATVSISAYAGITGNLDLEKMGFLKLSENYEDGKIEFNEVIENEDCKITLESMAGDNAYIIAEYNIKFTEKAIEELGKPEQYSNNDGYRLWIDNEVYINFKRAKNVTGKVYKISDIEYTYIQIINVMELKKEEFNLEIVFRGINTKYTGEKSQNIQLGKKIQADVTLKGNNQNHTNLAEQQLDENNKIIIQDIANTKFETFIKIKLETENLTYKEYNENPMEYNSFILNKENGEPVPSTVYSGDWYSTKRFFVQEDGKEIEKKEHRIQDNDKIRVEETFTILIGLEEDIEKIQLTPVKSRIYNDRTNEEAEMYDKATWYQLKEGDTKYSAVSGLGGTFDIDKIEIDDDNIVFYYNETGALGDEWRILIRAKNKKMNYAHPTKEEHKGLDSKENKITFSRSESGAGLNLHMISFDEIDNLEFTLLFGCVTEKIGEPIEFSIPDRNEETAKITNLKMDVYEEKKSLDMTSKYVDKEKLTAEYTPEQAIEDGCLVIKNKEIISNNKNQLEDFINDCNNSIDGVIRIYRCNNMNFNENIKRMEITDIQFEKGKFYWESYQKIKRENEEEKVIDDLHGIFVGDRITKDRLEDDYNYLLESETGVRPVCRIN